MSKDYEKAKKEYELVSSHLSDIQKIEMLPLEERQLINDAARKVLAFTRERKRFQKKERKLSEFHENILSRYEKDVIKDIGFIRENENLKESILSDKELLMEEKERIEEERNNNLRIKLFYKRLSIFVYTMLMILFAIIITISGYIKINIQIPFLLTAFMGAIAIVLIYSGIRKNQIENQVINNKSNKATSLLNQVIIKEVHNRNYLDYIYEKYKIDHADELEVLWAEYIGNKDAVNLYKDNTELLNMYQEELIYHLKRLGIKDTEMWVRFPVTLIDHKEMVELRHRLNKRRNSAREKIKESSSK